MDASDLLVEEHRYAAHLLDRLRQPAAQTAGLRMHLTAELRHELELHLAVEHDIFHPALAGMEELEQERDAIAEEERALAALLRRMEELPMESAGWPHLIREIAHWLEHHVRREEGKLYGAARRGLSGGVRHALADQMKNERERLVGIRGSVEDLLPPG